MNPILIQFEATTEVGPTYAARLLGVSYPTYAAYRNSSREFPHWHACHLRAILDRSKRDLQRYVKEHAYGTQR